MNDDNTTKTAKLTHFPLWQQDGDKWHLLVGNQTVVTLHPAERASGVPVYVVEISRDFQNAGEIAAAWHAGEFTSLQAAQDFGRQWWIAEGAKCFPVS